MKKFKHIPMHFGKEYSPEIGQRTMDWAGCVYVIKSLSLFGDMLFLQPLPQWCWSENKNDWVEVFHRGKEPMWHEISSLIPCKKNQSSIENRKSKMTLEMPL